MLGGAGADRPLAVVLGDLDLVAALATARIPCATVAAPADWVHFSRHVKVSLDWADPWTQPEALVDRLLAFAETQRLAPVLMPQTDGHLLAISRHRDALAERFRFILPPAELVEALVDKSRFQRLAVDLGLPVPRARVLRAGAPLTELDLRFPVVVKPMTRSPAWLAVDPDGKARQAADQEELERLWEGLDSQLELLIQEAVPGPEHRIESYHAYIDVRGETAGEFTGRKLRTYPERYGHTTALEITDSPDVRNVGREVLRRLGLRGVAKVDLKRGPDDHLHLLEVNPRFSLWHHPAALAGMNLPALVYADLTGSARPHVQPVRTDVRWCRPLTDLRAARERGQSPLRWLLWLRGCQARTSLSWSDPGPFLRGWLWPHLSSRWRDA